jgi:hypothetical protein
MKQEHRQFFRDVLQNLNSQSLAVFAGAGLSKAAGFVDWKGLLRDIADDLGLVIDQENDLISLAQYNVNKVGGRSMLNQKIIAEFNDEVELTENHKILARLPINTYWTTNYDDLLERSLKEAKRIADVKHSVSQLAISKPRRDAIIYKMHGDATLADEAVITKDDYERYFTDRASFVTALSGDLVSKQFVFIGFSFTDPNLDYVLSRVRLFMKNTERHHYYFIKKVQRTDAGINDEADYEYKLRKQSLFIDDLKRFKLQPVYVETYQEITAILREIEILYKKRTIFIGGSAEEYGIWARNGAQAFIHKLASRLIKEQFTIVNGFGWGVGSAVINGALETIYSRPERHGEDQLVIKPFPQFKSGGKELGELWTEYRSNMLDLAGVAIFLFGNKKNDAAEVVEANGLIEEFEIAKAKGLFLLPIPQTGYVSAKLHNELINDKYYTQFDENIHPLINQLIKGKTDEEIIEGIINTLKSINH